MKIVALSIQARSYVKSWGMREENVLFYHRDNDQPAVIFSDGYREWWKDGQFITSDGTAKVTY